MLTLTHKTYHEMGKSSGFIPLRPFGPAIGHATLPQQIVEDFNADLDRGTNGQDWSGKLVGRVNSENLIPPEIIQPHMKFFSECALHYVGDYAARHCEPFSPDIQPQVEVRSAWYVRSRAGDFNPVHLHTSAELSCIGYLQVPEGMEDDDHYPCRGHVEFLHGTHGVLNKPSFMVRPRVGSFFIFPGDLMHTVYPFQGDGERRSFSMNILLSEKDEEDDEGT